MAYLGDNWVGEEETGKHRALNVRGTRGRLMGRRWSLRAAQYASGAEIKREREEGFQQLLLHAVNLNCFFLDMGLGLTPLECDCGLGCGGWGGWLGIFRLIMSSPLPFPGSSFWKSPRTCCHAHFTDGWGEHMICFSNPDIFGVRGCH